MKTSPLLVLAFIGGTLSPFVAEADGQLQLSVPSALYSDPVAIRFTNAQPGQEVEIRAHSAVASNAWDSQASFKADSLGTVDLTRDAPGSGAYSGVVPMGLFLFMKHSEIAKAPSSVKLSDPRTTTIEALIDGRVVAVAQLERRWVSADVRITPLNEGGLVGQLFEPTDAARHPAILVLGGSEGGHDDADAALLASKGYVTLALAYFGENSLPKSLVKIPLEYLKAGIDWLRKRNSVDPDRLAVIGASKGAELALLLGATYPEIKAVVAIAPTSVAWSGLGAPYYVPSWTLQGQAVPYVQSRPSMSELFHFYFGGATGWRPAYENGLKHKEEVEKAAIHVEKTNGPLLLISGTSDGMWPSDEMATDVMNRLNGAHHPFADQHLSYVGAGHTLMQPYTSHLSDASWRSFVGGSPEADSGAFADAYPKMIGFLAHALNAEKLERATAN